MAALERGLVHAQGIEDLYGKLSGDRDDEPLVIRHIAQYLCDYLVERIGLAEARGRIKDRTERSLNNSRYRTPAPEVELAVDLVATIQSALHTKQVKILFGKKKENQRAGSSQGGKNRAEPAWWALAKVEAENVRRDGIPETNLISSVQRRLEIKGHSHSDDAVRNALVKMRFIGKSRAK